MPNLNLITEPMLLAALANDDLNDALYTLQNVVGIDDGGVASTIFCGFCGDPERAWPTAKPEVRRALLDKWIATERWYADDADGESHSVPDETTKLFGYLVEKYPDHEFEIVDKSALDIECEEAPVSIIAVTVDDFTMHDLFSSQCGQFTVDPMAEYRIETADAELIRDHNKIAIAYVLETVGARP